MISQIKPSFTKNNTLKLSISSDILNKKYKVCFSLVYSIKEIKGAIITNQIGRYYELNALNENIFIKLQTPKIGTYNLSCGPEGLFLIDKENKLVECSIDNLNFENEIKSSNYSNETIDDYVPIIPLPQKYSFDNEFLIVNDKTFQIEDEEIIKNSHEITSKLGVYFSETEGIKFCYLTVQDVVRHPLVQKIIEAYK